MFLQQQKELVSSSFRHLFITSINHFILLCGANVAVWCCALCSQMRATAEQSALTRWRTSSSTHFAWLSLSHATPTSAALQISLDYSHFLWYNLIVSHRRQNTVVFNCRIRCPSELGLLHLRNPSSIFFFFVRKARKQGSSKSKLYLFRARN